MAMTSSDLAQAKALVGNAGSAADFTTAATASDIRWWDATPTQRTELMAASSQADVKEIVGGYCKSIGEGTARNFLLKSIIPPDRRGRAFWFQEYLLESSRGVSAEDKKRLTEAFNKLLYKTGSGMDDLKLKLELDRIPTDKFRAMLLTFLNAGFVKVPTTSQELLTENFEDLVQRSMKLYGGDKKYKIRWRSDARSYDEIKTAGGFLAKARSADSYASSLGMRDAWHPFSDPNVRKYMWFRKGHADNCLNTVVSVGIAKEWKAYLPFPLMRDYPNKIVKKKILVKTGSNQYKPVTLPVSYTWLYLFVMADLLALKTGAMGTHYGEKAYPEIGVGEIPIGNVYGAVKFARVFHKAVPADLNAQTGGELDEAGFSAFPVASLAPPQTDFAYSQQSPLPPGVLQVRKAFSAVLHTAPVHVRWTSTGFADVPAAFSIGAASVEVTAGDFKGL